MHSLSKKGGYQAHCDEDKKMNRPIQVIFGLCNTTKRQNHWTSLTNSVALLTQWSPNRDFMYKCKCIYVSKYNLNWLGLATFRIN